MLGAGLKIENTIHVAVFLISAFSKRSVTGCFAALDEGASSL